MESHLEQNEAGTVSRVAKPSIRSLFVTSFAVFAMLAGALAWLDFLPESPETAIGDALLSNDSFVLGEESQLKGEPVLLDSVPKRVIIESIEVDANIENPKSTAIEDLDTALLDGVVRYPGSGDLVTDDNLFLFGHSSFLPVIHNENYKVFNKLKELDRGALIRIQSGTHENVYRVTAVRLTTAEEAFVELGIGKKKLTLSTCNSFGEKSERYVVEAEFIDSYAL